MGIQAPAKVKFALIYEAICHDDNVLSISYLCDMELIQCLMGIWYRCEYLNDRVLTGMPEMVSTSCSDC